MGMNMIQLTQLKRHIAEKIKQADISPTAQDQALLSSILSHSFATEEKNTRVIH